jgi:hypothetical protein
MALGPPGASLLVGGGGGRFRPSEKCELKLLSAVLEANQSLRGLKKVTLVGPRFRREHEGCGRPVAANVLRLIQPLRAEGRRLHEIANTLNACGVHAAANGRQPQIADILKRAG